MMDAHPEQFLDAYIDGELDLAGQLAFEARLRTDPALAGRVEARRELRDAVRAEASYHRAPDRLRARLSSAAGLPEALGTARDPVPRRAPATSARAAFAGRRTALQLGLAVLLAGGATLAGFDLSREARLRDAVVASHVRATLGEHLVDIASSDHHAVKPWLSARLDFSPPVVDAPLPDMVFLGGRVDYLDDRPVAALAYRRGRHTLDLFVWPADGGDSAPAFSQARGFRTAHWRHDGMTHWAVSDLGPEEFAAAVAALR